MFQAHQQYEVTTRSSNFRNYNQKDWPNRNSPFYKFSSPHSHFPPSLTPPQQSQPTDMGLKIAENSNIRHIVRLHQMLRRWKIRSMFSQPSSAPPDVPEGHVAVCVGRSSRRYVVRVTHLNHPVFRELLARAEEEYGFDNVGPISIPCDESDFEQILHHIISSSSSKFPNLEESRRYSSCCCCCCHVSIRRALQGEALPLLRGFAKKSVW